MKWSEIIKLIYNTITGYLISEQVKSTVKASLYKNALISEALIAAIKSE